MVKEKPPNGGVQEPAMHYYSVAATSLFLATKVEENCRKMKELVVACVRVAQKDPSKVVDEQDKEYWRWRDTLLQMEDLLLEAICFDLSVEPPYKALYDFLLRFKEDDKRLRNAALAFLNDSCLTMLCLLFPSRTIAASALYAAAKHCGVRFQDESGRPWWDVVGVELRHIRRACNYMAEIYENNPLRGGPDGGIYERTPEDGDEWSAKTREKVEGIEAEAGSQDMSTALSNTESESWRKRRWDDREEVEANGNNEAHGDRLEGTNGYEASQEENRDNIAWGGEMSEEREIKRQKLNAESNGTAAPSSQSQGQGHGHGITTNGTAVPSAEAGPENENHQGLQSPKSEDVSEEGEVEP